jgi:bis(5'-nucleosyl)-tetraphosphatase (symmetrical)
MIVYNGFCQIHSQRGAFMAIYAIGDIQGCFQELQALLRKIEFQPDRDQLWFTGDLINRGPESLEVLRFVKQLDDRAVTVLGNHDLHCLAVAFGYGKLHDKDTLADILTAPDRDELLTWLCQRPVLHHDESLDVSLIHAGLPPQWDLAQARECASELEQVLRGENPMGYFANMYGDGPYLWDEDLRGWDRLRFITNCLTRLRFVDARGQLCLSGKGPPGSQPKGWVPWFQAPQRKSAGHKILFGHWSALGLYLGDDVIGLDTGCLWGGALTALKLEPSAGSAPQVTRVDCAGVMKPHQ